MKNLICLLLLAPCFALSQTKTNLNIIPQPVSIQMGNGQFTLTKKTVIVASDAEDRKTANYLNDYLQQTYGFRLDVDKRESKNYIRLTTKKFIKAPDKDAYNLTVTPEGVAILGDTYEGTFYGVQTLIQLLPTTPNFTLRQAQGQTPNFSVPVVAIQDYPRFAYRGMHLDVGRHFFPPSFVKRYIDYLALHKLNYFHWHLTEDQGWRIEIKKYPKLMSEAAYRNGTITGRYPGTGNDNLRYGGYYTQDEVREIVKYAADRRITVIPEIEMPGHSSAAIAAYPWLSCFPLERTVIPYHPSQESTRPDVPAGAAHVKLVQETWGVFEDIYCAGKDSTFLFLQDVLDEVMAIFPSQYIHVGGDEAPKLHWKRCPLCQARIKAEGLKDEHGLQSYFIQRMEKYLNGKGRTIIGWDEILEGGLAPNAVVMSWRGEQGGIEAAKQKHQVIMTPQKPVYFDHSQTKNEDSLVIGGYNPIEAVYAYEPVPKELSADEAKYILGAQANLWTEYVAYPSKVEYMVFPRMSALSEVLWSPKEKRDWKDFEQRLQTQFKRYDLWKANYSKAYFDLQSSILPTPNNEGVIWKLQSRSKADDIVITKVIGYGSTRSHGRYPLGKGENSRLINSDGMYVASLQSQKLIKKTLQQFFCFSKATGKKVSITAIPNEKYPGQAGAFSLVNGVYSNKGLSYPDWLGFVGDDLEATIDLGKTEKIDSVRMHTVNQNGSWIYLPQYVEVFTSTDGKDFTSVGKSSDFTPDTLTMGWITVPVQKKGARYIKLLAKNYGLIPDGKPGGGNKAWLFADEIQVY